MVCSKLSRRDFKKSSADADLNGIDFSCDKGYTYQVKATRGKTYTFNCIIDEFREHLKADQYIFIQIHDNIAYIENMYNRNYVEENIKPSFQYHNCFIWAKDLKQQELVLF